MRSSIQLGPTGVILALALSPILSAQGTYTDLGRGSAYDVSADGSVVVGLDFFGAYRWTQAGGSQQLGLVRGLHAVSADGNVISGEMDTSLTPSGLFEAGRWTQSTGWVNLGGLPGSTGCDFNLSHGYDISDDGSVLVGLGWEGCKGRAFRWSAATGMVQLGQLGPISSRANAVSGDGLVVGGWDEANNGQRRASVWYPNGSEVLLIPPSPQNPNGAGEVWDLNSDGSVIVGEETGGEAFRWTAASGYEGLGGFPGSVGGDTGSAQATNEDGSMIVGTSGSFFTGFGAFVWTEEDGMKKMFKFLLDQGISVPEGPAFTWGFGVTPHGTHIVGRRGSPIVPPGFDRGFLVRLPAGIRYGIDASPANTLNLTGTGSNSLGGTLVVTTTGAPGAQTLTLVSGASAHVPLLGGVILVDLAGPVIVLTAPTSGGVSSHSITLPNSPAHIGGQFYMQSATLDPSQPAGWAMSNGIKVTITN